MKKTIILFVGIGIIVGFIMSLGTYKGVKETSGDKFCVSCHSMEPMVGVYRDDVHGGNNPVGIQAKCVDCHLPHDSLASYLYTKAKNGAIEVAITAFGDPEKINWIEKRKERERYVYDSGCMNCHTNILEQKTAKNPKQIEMHEHYKNKLNTKKPLNCVSCHISVGHHGLRNELNKITPEYTPVIEEGH